jgi:DNA replication and repair protein RecF
LRLHREPGARATRSSLVNGTARAARSLLGLCPVVLFWPEDLDLVKGGPDGRRRRLDMLHSQVDPRAAADLVRYRRVMEQRNALLRQLREQRGSLTALTAFDHELVELGGRIQCGRAALVRSLEGPAITALAALSIGRDDLRLVYRPDGLDDPDVLAAAGEQSSAQAALATRLAQRHSEELLRAVTLAGPHRDDVEILLGDRGARTSASQGQHRSIVLALTLAEVSHIRLTLGLPPVLLLDDVLSELDATRREALLDYVAHQPDIQVLVTSAEPTLLDRAGHTPQRRLVVEAGVARIA